MASFLSKAWFQSELNALRERAATWPMPWQVNIINSLLYLRKTPDDGCLGVYRRSDNQLVLRMTDLGDIYPAHHGLWEPEFALALGEALVLLARIHQERTSRSGEKPVPVVNASRYPELERSFALEAFFDIVDATAVEITKGRMSAEPWASSRERYDDCLRWANEFERLHAGTEWDAGSDETDYFISIENFISTKLTELQRH